MFDFLSSCLPTFVKISSFVRVLVTGDVEELSCSIFFFQEASNGGPANKDSDGFSLSPLVLFWFV